MSLLERPGGVIALAHQCAEAYLKMNVNIPSSIPPEGRRTIMLLGLIRATVVAARWNDFSEEELQAAVKKEMELFDAAQTRVPKQ